MVYENTNGYKKVLIAVVAGGAIAGGGFLAYRWWSWRSASCCPKRSPQDATVIKIKEELKVTDKMPSTSEPATEKVELRVPSVVREKIGVTMPLPAPDVINELSMSSTFEKVSTSVSPEPEPDSFVQLSMSTYQESADLPVTTTHVPGATATPRLDSEAPPTESRESSIELLSESSSSFIAISSLEETSVRQTVSTAVPSAAAGDGLPVRVIEGTGEDEVQMKDGDDIVHVEKSSEHVPHITGPADDKSSVVTAVDLAAGGLMTASPAAEKSRMEAGGGDDSIVSVEYDNDDHRVSTGDIGDVRTNSGERSVNIDDDDDDAGDDTVEYDVSDVSGVLDSAATSGTRDRVEE
jgi:hypothetical protein